MSRFNVNICDFENELADTKCSYNALRFPVNISEMKCVFFKTSQWFINIPRNSVDLDRIVS